MNSTQALTFEWSLWTLLLSVVLVSAAAAFCFTAWRRSGYRRAIGALELLRLTLIVLALLLLNQPEWVQQYRPQEKPTVAVLYDASASMDTVDGQIGESGPPVPRKQAIAALTEPETWQSLEERMNVVIQPFAGSDSEEGSDLAKPLSDVIDEQSSLLGVVLASDGDWNIGAPPVDAAARLRSKGVPVFAVPAGRDSQLPDVELLSFDVPTVGVGGKAVRIPLTIESALPRDYQTTIVLRSSDGETISKDIRILAMGRTSDAIIWKPSSTGDFTLTLEIPKHSSETLAENNQMTAPISIREEKLRVLVIESYPRWEYRYLRNALSRDPGIEVSCLLFHPKLEKTGGGNADYIKDFPAGRDELSQYDVVFLGDVGIEDDQLTDLQCEQLKGLVEHQASGLVFIPGWQGRQFSLLETKLSELYPVVMDALQPDGWGSRTPSHFELTELGRRSLLTKLADTRDDNVEVWEGLPGFQWYAPVTRARAGSEVLAVHKDISNEYGRLPLLATRTYGAGKVLFMGTDGAWRWRKGVEDLYHYRFWGQVVRWMAYQRNMAKGETMRLYYSPEQPQVRQTVTLTANVMENSGEPLSDGDVTARIVGPSGRGQTVQLASQGDQWGAFAGRFSPQEAGKHAVTLACQQTGATLETSLFVQGAALERVGKPARPEVLEEIARVTRGQVIQMNHLDSIKNALRTLPDPPPAVRRVQLWSHPLVAGGMIFLLGVFWIGRKAVGLI
ncbi:hypothetical protein [Roseimaritima ulvae]|uniref:Glutamine amidotransferase domain-containing protein n=1 Tax=Roseimaritima ulvae TaxID=980254 RepID=A0A5B9QLC5_9BACT|nr:hypothetical protein [Roseimaritima ulvae]QEG38592.1 hypothetical protein UC8_05490 [Roseimaritima ulvae]